MSRDGSSGGAIRLGVINKDGIHKKIHDSHKTSFLYLKFKIK